MSMLSAQVDELRAMAESVGLEVPQAATLMMGAADAILELRDDLQRANAESARLRSELEAVGIAAYSYGRGDLKAENEKLRELVRELWTYAEQELVCDWTCPYGATCNWMDSDVVCVFKRRMRELGIEDK